METDWAENRAELPPDFLRQSMGKFGDVFYTTYKRDKFRTRIERGTEPGTVEIYVSQRRMEQVPTVKIDNVSPAGFAWAVMPPNPGLEAELLTRLMVKFGDAGCAGRAGGRGGQAPAPGRARAHRQGGRRLAAALRRRHVRPRLAPRRPGARPHRLHRRRPRPLEGRLLRPLRRSRCRPKKDDGLPVEAHVLEGQRRRSPSSTGSSSPSRRRAALVTVQDAERRAGQDAEQREDPRAAQGPAQVMAAVARARSAGARPPARGRTLTGRRCASRPSAAAAKATASSSRPAAPAS